MEMSEHGDYRHDKTLEYLHAIGAHTFRESTGEAETRSLTDP